MRWLILFMLLATSAWAQFPTTGVLDNFDRADEDPIGGDWSNGVNGSGSCDIAGNALVGAQNGGCWWNASSFGENQEVFMTFSDCDNLVTTPPSTRYFL